MEVTDDRDVLDRVLDPNNLHAAYQPIVDIASGETVAYEALARWQDHDLRPDVAFPIAGRAGRLAELDWACRAAALRGALKGGLGEGASLFVNVETAAIGTGIPSELEPLLAEATAALRVVVEITERDLLRDPGGVLRIADWARERSWGVALDDVGALPASLTLLPFVAPDVVKLDMALIQDRIALEQAEIVAAVLAHSESTGASILAEGIETDAHLERALGLGATLGQGWYFGKPGPLEGRPEPAAGIPLSGARLAPDTPFSLVRHSDRLRVARKSLLLEMSHHIESIGLGAGSIVLLSTFQTADRFTAATARRYATLGARCALVGALGVGMPPEPAPGVRGASLAVDDELRGEWTVVSVGSHYAGAMIARDLGDDGPDPERRFEFLVTHDRSLVLAAARSLMARLLPA